MLAYRKYITLLLLTVSLGASGKRSVLPGKVVGIWCSPTEQEDTMFTWQAKWIWVDQHSDADAIFARKTIHLEKLPKRALLRITASSLYQLYINGEYICSGPARSAPHHQSYDILDISAILHTGNNAIAIRVHHQHGKKSYQYDGRSGLLAQINVDDASGDSVFVSSAQWKVLPDYSWDNKAPRISRFNQIVNDRVDFRHYPKGWETINFDDRAWADANELMREQGWPLPQKNAKARPLTPPWTSLVPRDIPYLREQDIPAEKIISAFQSELSIQQNDITLRDERQVSLTKGAPILLPPCSPTKSWLLVFDFGSVINGMPKMDIEGAAGTEVVIVTAPYLLNNQLTKVTVDSEFLDKIVLSGGHDQWESTYFKPTRYLALCIKNAEPFRIYSTGIHQLSYPYHASGHINSADAQWINNYMAATAKTIDACTTDALTDNYRERRQYAQTDYYGAMGNYWIFGDYALQRRCLVQVAQEQLANGIMPAYAPAASDDYMIILDSNCLWIRSLRNYLLYSGDEKTVRMLLPSAIKLMELLQSFTNRLGLIDNPPYPYWLDHAQNDRRGANFCLNGHYLGALEDFGEVLDWLGQPGVEVYRKRSKNIRQAMQQFWNSDKQLFADALIDNKQSDMYSEHAQAMALAMRVATPAQAEAIAKQILKKDHHNYITRASGITMVTPAMSYSLHRGLCKYGFIDESFALLQSRFDKMLQPPYNGTLWEEWWLDATGRTGKLQKGRTRSDAQTESAFAPALIAEFIAGVVPVRPGMKEIVIRRTATTVKDLHCTIPTPQGSLKVDWEIGQTSGKLMLVVPAGMEILLDIPSLQKQGDNDIKVNNEEIEVNSSEGGLYRLAGGMHTIKF